MTYTYIGELMDGSTLLGKETLSELETLVKIYPYFQTGRILHLKNLQQVNDKSFSQELPKIALCVADRSKLFYHINGYPQKPEKREMFTLSELKERNRTMALIDAFLSEEETNEKIVVTSEENAPSEQILLSQDNNKGEGDIPLSQKMLISYDYLSFLLNSHHMIAENNQDEFPERVKLQHQDLIDNFISENDGVNKIRIRVPDTDEIKNDPVLKKEREEKEEFFSETLAKIYIKQKRYEKALDIIRKLYLKFPEKNIYFADQIRFLELLITNSK